MIPFDVGDGSKPDFWTRPLLRMLYPRKRTSVAPAAMSAPGQQETFDLSASVSHLRGSRCVLQGSKNPTNDLGLTRRHLLIAGAASFAVPVRQSPSDVE